ncbi:MAG: hypothetical protein V3V20_00510 [Algisphaera sp.]
MRHSLIAILTFTLNAVSVAEESTTIAFPATGYTINALDPGKAQSGAFQSMTMLLPPKDGFASNINIQHQAFPGTLQDYATLTKTQFIQMDCTTLNSAIQDDVYSTEATGKFPGIEIELHFYLRAIKSGDNVILATATIPTDRWETEKQILLPIVDSLKPYDNPEGPTE